MNDMTLTDIISEMRQRVKDQCEPGIENVKVWAESLYRLRARDDQAFRGFLDRDTQQRLEIESLKEKLEIEIECSKKNAERKNAEITILRKELDSLRRGK